MAPPSPTEADNAADKSAPVKMGSRAALFRGTNPGVLRLDSKPSVIRKQSSSLLFPKNAAEQELVVGPGIELIYFSGWKPPYLHHVTADGSWTVVPGNRMGACVRGGYDDAKAKKEVWEAHIKGVRKLEFVPNDGGSQWDKAPGNRNYVIETPGIYKLQGGRLEMLIDPPDAPSLLTAKEVGSSYVRVAWAPPAMNAHLVKGYKLYRNGEEVAETAEDALEHEDRPLLGLTEYAYTVSAVNIQNAEGEKTKEIKVKTGEPGKPMPPEDLKVEAHSSKSISLGWNCPSDTGGAPIAAYRIFRNGKFVAVMRPDAEVVQSGDESPSGGLPSLHHPRVHWKDTTVKQGECYSYCVTADHRVPSPPPETGAGGEEEEAEGIPKGKGPDTGAGASPTSKDKEKNAFQITVGKTESQPCDDVEAKAVEMLRVPRLGDRDPHIMLQGFNWDSCNNPNGWYKVVESKLPEIAKAKISMLWLPPPAQSVDSHGYLPQGWYNLNSKYGKEAELRSLIQKARELQICPVVDVVINHRCADGRGSAGDFTDYLCEPKWGSWAIVSNDPKVRGKGAPSQFQNIEYAPDIDHSNPKVQKDVKHWLKWLRDDVGFGALRLDFVLGYSPQLQAEYIESVGSPYAVSEYWHGDPRVLRNYIHAVRGRAAVFDFPTYYCLRSAVHSNDFGGLRRDQNHPNGIMGEDPVRCMSFIENHDTCHLEVVGGPFGNNEQVLRAYAYLLTHPGIPSIFWTDFFDRGKELTEKLTVLCNLRAEKGLHCRSGVFIDCAHLGLYAAFISKNEHCNRGGGMWRSRWGQTTGVRAGGGRLCAGGPSGQSGNAE
uniref:Fibronectin type-III domain-containing protein n=1 Tax=Chromera velia CCMP2878 TaxID=1169474 RepID=A0A0G4GAC1_9ALVE|eukprot:Cvel_4418.t1-p1 / transcript=Cvel_4418.t1 / gene=Cvel_4418 / organism=Chromera_velia_CCMP2878 / gene_product=Alpha-amylase AMY3, putative / transcript_product=Alpha-amylase AMY3, putative / location=Cvel_scaffold192:52234-61663(-) / protein_length=823 / sequence_SO=supercontig / SO=protein_coding / is_pseudo=false